MDNKTVFENELNLIQNEALREFVGNVLNGLPDYFRKIGASTSGKYHPAYTIGEGGLIRHTKACVGIAKELLRAELYYIESNEHDIVYASLLLHDGLKCGMWEDKTAFNHPILMSNYLEERAVEYQFADNYTIKHIRKCIESHMGKWNTSNYSDLILPTPQTDLEKLVHLCDYIASRKCLTYNFDEDKIE